MRSTLLVVFGSAVLMQVHGQVSIGNRAGIGLFRQYIVSDEGLPGDYTTWSGTLVAPTIAIPIDIRFTRFLGLVIEPAFVQRGRRFEQDGYVSTERVNGLELALLLKGSKEFGRWTPYVLAGPSVTRQLSVHITNSTPSGSDDEGTVTVDDISFYKTAYVSMFAGAGLSFSIGAPRLFLDYRALWGLAPSQSGDLVDVNFNVTHGIGILDRGHIISIGCSIPLSREAWRATPLPKAEEPPAP